MEIEAIPKPRRPIRRMLMWGAPIACPVIFLMAWLGYEWYQDRELRAAIAEADRLDPGWRLAELEAARAEVPDEENAALQVLAARRLIPPGWFPTPVAGIPSFEEEINGLPPPLALDLGQSQKLRAQLAKASAALTAASKVALMPRGRFHLVWSHDAMSTPMSQLQAARELAQLLRLGAFQQAQDRDLEGAIASCRAILNTGRSIGDEPFAISQLVRLWCLRLSLRTLERVLAQSEVSEETLQTVQRFLEDQEKEPLILMAARAERANIHQFLEVAEAGRLDRASYGMMSRTGSYKIDNLLDRGKARGCHAAYLRFLTQCVEISELPPEEQVVRFQQLNMKEPENIPELLAGLNRDSGFKVIARLFHYDLAFLRCGIAAVAVERYRLANGRWPNNLDELMPRYLSVVPLDPFDGQQLRYRRLEDGVLIYTIGAERKDDGGQRVRIRAGAPDVDVGFQLWDVNRRRQLPRPK